MSHPDGTTPDVTELEPQGPEQAVVKAVHNRLAEAKEKDLLKEEDDYRLVHLLEEHDDIRTIYSISERGGETYVRKMYSVDRSPIITAEELRQGGYGFTDAGPDAAAYAVLDRYYEFSSTEGRAPTYCAVDLHEVDAEGVRIKWRQATTYRPPAAEVLSDLESKIGSLPFTSPDSTQRDYIEGVS